MKRRRKKSPPRWPKLCPICNGYIDRRCKWKVIELAGKPWHQGCLEAMVTAMALTQAALMLQDKRRGLTIDRHTPD